MARGFRSRTAAFACALCVCLGVSLPAGAQEAEDQQVVSTAVIPVVGSVRGWDEVLWRADVRLSNPWREPLDVILTAPAAGDAFLFFTLQPDESLPLPDIAREAFNLQGALTPLVVQTLGNRSVSVETLIQGEGRDGAVRPQSPRTMYSLPQGGMAFLSGLRIDEDHRTNIGLVNLGEDTVLATLSIQRISGRPLETMMIDLPPHSLSQRPLGHLFPTVVQGSDLTLVIEFSSSSAYAYASVLDNETHTGRFVGP